MAKSIIGTVSSSKADKTIVVTVRSRKTHPVYRKQFSVSKKFMAHDPKNEAQVGDKVEITETRPLSARKRHILSRIVEKPALREDTLKVAKSDDTGSNQRASAKKDSDEDEETKQ